jgi:hypothetical protein
VRWLGWIAATVCVRTVAWWGLAVGELALSLLVGGFDGGSHCGDGAFVLCLPGEPKVVFAVAQPWLRAASKPWLGAASQPWLSATAAQTTDPPETT